MRLKSKEASAPTASPMLTCSLFANQAPVMQMRLRPYLVSVVRVGVSSSDAVWQIAA